jgi:hypothetical protein
MDLARGGLAAILVAALGHGPVLADMNGPSDDTEIQATAYDAIPHGAAFDVEAADGSELTHEVERLVRASVERLGYGLDDDAPLVLSVATESAGESAESPLPLQLGASKGSVRMRLFLLGPNSSGLLQDSRRASAADYRIALSVHDRRTQRYVWRGLAAICRCGQSVRAASRAAVPTLVEAIGYSVGPQPADADASR